MMSTGRSGTGRKKKMVMFSALWRAGAMLLITMTALEKALQFYVCPPECCSAEYPWNRPGGSKDQEKRADNANAAAIGQKCIINYADVENCYNAQGEDAHEIVKQEWRAVDTKPDEMDETTAAFIRFVKKNHKEVLQAKAEGLFEEEVNMEFIDRTLHTECGDFKKVYVGGRWTFVAQN